MKILQAGPIRVGYENGFLRRISYSEKEVLRMIYFALRDHNWNTLSGPIENENIAIRDKGFEIIYDCFNLDGGVTVMEWNGKITGKPDGTIIFEIQGKAREDFKKNRAGFCVLHPLNIIGLDCAITHPDGTEATHSFPVEVAPENPFKNIQSMRWKTADIPFSLSFEGDIFETEDQRNWSDASFKTFCTPLDKPFPVELKRGDKVFQRITFKPQDSLPPAKTGSSYVTLRDTGIRSFFPALGIAASTEIRDLPANAISLLKELKLKHYRVEVYPGKEDWVTDFSHHCESGYALGLPLEVVLHLTDGYLEEIESFVVLCQQNRVNLRKVLLLQDNALVTGQHLVDQVSGLKEVFPKVLFGAGTDYNFNEINKDHFIRKDLDYISFSIDPQEHASDDLTILENTETQEHLVKSAKSIYGVDMPVHISPLVLKKRYNPYATNPADLFLDESEKTDARQKEIFAAIWTFGSLCSLSKGGAAAITFFQTIGNQGVMSTEANPYPVYHALKSFSVFQGKPVNILESSDPLAVQGILLNDKILALVNLTQQEKSVHIHDKEFTLAPREMKFETLHRA